MKPEKTNVMRLLEQKKIPYTPRVYPHQEGVAVDGVTVAHALGLAPGAVFKTLVTRGKGIYVFVLPAEADLHLKRAASAVGEKSVELVRPHEILSLTGYVRGGCSPIGMKKQYLTILDESAVGQSEITLSAGKIGHQVTLRPHDLIGLIGCATAPVADWA